MNRAITPREAARIQSFDDISMGLSMKNKWLDEENRVYIIYQIAEIQEDLGLSKKKAIDYLGELERFGLVEKKRRGLDLIPEILH